MPDRARLPAARLAVDIGCDQRMPRHCSSSNAPRHLATDRVQQRRALQQITRAREPRHDGADRYVRDARDLLVRQLLELLRISTSRYCSGNAATASASIRNSALRIAACSGEIAAGSTAASTVSFSSLRFPRGGCGRANRRTRCGRSSGTSRARRRPPASPCTSARGRTRPARRPRRRTHRASASAPGCRRRRGAAGRARRNDSGRAMDSPVLPGHTSIAASLFPRPFRIARTSTSPTPAAGSGDRSGHPRCCGSPRCIRRRVGIRYRAPDQVDVRRLSVPVRAGRRSCRVARARAGKHDIRPQRVRPEVPVRRVPQPLPGQPDVPIRSHDAVGEESVRVAADCVAGADGEPTSSLPTVGTTPATLSAPPNDWSVTAGEVESARTCRSSPPPLSCPSTCRTGPDR